MTADKARLYFPIIERIFAEERVPDAIKYLAIQESSLIPDAVSSANAVGYWQFKDFTAREVGLRVDRQVDERKNIVSASQFGSAPWIEIALEAAWVKTPESKITSFCFVVTVVVMLYYCSTY
jgi:membrane-bound lytic murein transglycosylase D